MDYKIIITSLIPTIVTLLIAWINHKYDFKGIVKKAEIESKDDIYHSWKEFSETQKADNDELRKNVSDLQEQMKTLQAEFDLFRKETATKEEGYQLRIEQLETENEELKDTIDDLQGENETLIAENTILKGGQI